jgi:hypothetical protein
MSSPFKNNTVVEQDIIDIGGDPADTHTPATTDTGQKSCGSCGCGGGGGWHGPCMWILVGALATLAVQHLVSKGFSK